jgi:hypothetical protein
LDANDPRRVTDERSLAEIVTEVSEHASSLVRQEIELARTEIEEKITRLARGAIAGAVAGVFVLFALIYLLESAAWGLNSVLDSLWLGFLIVGVVLVLLGVVGGLIASRSIKAGAPPTPDQAIQEARLIKEAIEHPEVQAAMARTSDRPTE